jgi:sulfur carrier protein ThiS
MKHFFIWVSIPLQVTVTFARTNQSKTVSLQKDATIQHLLEHLRLKPDTCLTLINNKPIPLDDNLDDGQNVTILEVTSGG